MTVEKAAVRGTEMSNVTREQADALGALDDLLECISAVSSEDSERFNARVRHLRAFIKAAPEKGGEKTRMFPIMGWRPIPWSVLEPREDWAQRNHSQSLFTLAQRGGLSPSEAVAIIEGRRWHRMNKAEAEKRLAELTAHARPAAAKEPGVTEETLTVLDEACEAMELHGWHDVPEYKNLKALHAALSAAGQER